MKTDNCRVCGSGEYRPVAEVEGFNYVRCACGVERMSGYPGPAEVHEFYESGYMERKFNNLGHHLHFKPEYREAYFAEKWLYYLPVQHIHLFSQESLFKLLSDSGFSVISWVRFGSCNPKDSIPDVNKRAIDTIVKRLGIGDTIVVRAGRAEN